MSLEKYFDRFRKGIIGIDESFETPYGVKKMIYADWTASGRLFRPIEEKMLRDFGPFVANTHTETTFSGSAMTLAYHEARELIKKLDKQFALLAHQRQLLVGIIEEEESNYPSNNHDSGDAESFPHDLPIDTGTVSLH